MKNKINSKVLILIIVIVIVVVAFVGLNIFRYPTMFRHLTNESLSEQEAQSLKKEITTKEDKKILVAYFSYSGTTKNVAEILNDKVNGDLFAIERKEEYSNPYTQGNSEIRKNIKPELKNTIDNIDDYDIVFVGFPIWFHATPTPINTFLESYDLKGKLIIPFCTSGESDIEEAMPTFLNSSKDLAVYGQRRIASINDIDKWLEELDLNI